MAPFPVNGYFRWQSYYWEWVPGQSAKARKGFMIGVTEFRGDWENCRFTKLSSRNAERLAFVGGSNMTSQENVVRLEIAMIEGDLFAVRRLVAKGLDPNTLISTRFTALTATVIGGEYDVVETLLDVGADPNLPMLGELPLNWACRDGDREMCEILVAGGADPFRLDSDRRSAYWVACAEQQHYDLFDWLCQHAARSQPEAVVANAVLCLAALHGRPVGIGHLLDAGISVNGRDADGATALHHAASAGHVACAELLLERGATIESRDNDGLTPLHHACMEGAREAAELLIARGASVSSKDAFGNTPLHICVIFRRRKCAHMLLDHGADPAVPRSDDATPMYLAFGDWQEWLADN